MIRTSSKSKLIKIFALLVVSILPELKLLLSRKIAYEMFLNWIDPIVTFGFGVAGMLLITMIAVKISRKISYKLILGSFLFIGLTKVMMHQRISTNGKDYYRIDGGISALNLYLDNDNHRYILKETWPFGGMIYIGKYIQNGSEVVIDQSLNDDRENEGQATFYLENFTKQH
ncbi:hypothetical protein GC194_09400 [bacterium]|nr:hypothetical protein [bacterium]